MTWKKLPLPEINRRVFEAIGKNVSYQNDAILGLPASYLDQEQFSFDAPFLTQSPFLSALVHNPNHIGCHTYSAGESYFKGTQALEVDLLRICAQDIFGAQVGEYDGYVAPGGTEANIQAQWVFRNYYQKEKQAQAHEIGLVFSQDTHYSAYKGCNLLGLKPIAVNVLKGDDQLRGWDFDHLVEQLEAAQRSGIKHVIVHLTMGTTMFGSIDRPAPILAIIKKYYPDCFVHVDAAFGGFIYPFTKPDTRLTFANPDIQSVTMDGHKMLQAPYGTGVFLCRKGLINYAQTEEASYVQGTDFTLCGSRSGANAIALWMIVMSYGYGGWKEQMDALITHTDFICEGLDTLGVEYFRNSYMNIIAMKAHHIPVALAQKYHLVADNFDAPKWWKIVVMMHVKPSKMDAFLADLKASMTP
ncbi:MAG TPA: aspartate aminotransferase family protein [Hellea balneolensis]|uniref:Aspartate aminotransferase family protein n=1 Tax=Hellea balneolensis TaxID=287478 RepID=A0A7C3C3Y2_9PROT|nr:aspartate aminotransferase family protein [Hellea balneolensis]